MFRFASGCVVNDRKDDSDDGLEPRARGDRRVRADARRNLDTLLQTAMAVFASSGVDAPVREIAERAGVGIGTVYRHFPQRSDLIAAVFRREIDACADAASTLSAGLGPFDALANWMQRYAAFVAAKRGLAKALHSGDPAFDSLPGYFDQRLRPALRTLLKAATDAGEIRADVDADELLGAVASLCMSAHNAGSGRAERMVALLVDGLRHGAKSS
ncbi:TetR/AcrR family transcriptional regulator [Mesorhizobium sp. NZP2298]|uniref:TetR/AcrR family transcriptional regulator n=1 Tax=Mesorhizobium sp. NZP2298 TaxID=2483403 RepID=UPI0015574531|nr:TetR/AcrR family transcriptional regulator [Mesorhizobium sp. NZP2298]QKC94611.1 TetR/AcrR family transcriptional regulator [Mesorhizobium sp. NZP2298]